MENLNKVFKADIAAISDSAKTFRDIYNVMFSHEDHIAYEVLKDYEVKRFTYKELRNRINEFTGFIKQKHPQTTNEYIGIDLPNGPEFLTAFWAILQSGNKPYLVNSFYPAQLRIKLLDRLGAHAIITDSDDYQDFTVINTVCMGQTYEYDSQIANWANEMAISSSLTGLEAKICVFDGESVVKQVLSATGIIKKNKWLMLRYNGQIKIIAILPFFHIFGIIVSYFWFAFFGRTIVFVQNYSPEYIRGVINRHQITHVFAPPLLYHKLYKGIMNNVLQETQKRKKQFDVILKLTFAIQDIFPILGVKLSKMLFSEIINATFGKSVQFMITGGAFIENDALRLINNIGYPLFNGYGTTETAITSADFRKRIKHRVSGSIGLPFNNITYSLSDEQTLTISGDSICKKIISFNSEQSGFDCIHTSDMAKTIKGQYYIIGRKTDLFIGDNGENISPDIIQNELKIKNASNYSVVDIDGKLSLVLEYNAMLPDLIIKKETDKIKQDLQSIHYGLAVSEIFITRDKISRENAVKVSRELLKKMISEGDVRLQNYRILTSGEAQMDAASDGSVETVIKGIFQKALDTSADIDNNANFFFDLGGTSLDYFMMISDISTVFNVQINLEKKNNLYTVADIYKYLMEAL